jgi:hypothetical protein
VNRGFGHQNEASGIFSERGTDLGHSSIGNSVDLNKEKMSRLLDHPMWIRMDIQETADPPSCPPPFGIFMTEIPGKFIFRFDQSR